MLYSVYSITPIISYLLNASTFLLGSLFLSDPSYVLGFLGDHSDENNLQETILSKLVGGLLIGFTLTVIFLGMQQKSFMESLPDDGSDEVKCRQGKEHRTTLCSHSMLGLIFLLIGIFSGDVNGDQTIILTFVGVGSSIVLLGCTGLMISYYPFDEDYRPGEMMSQNNTNLKNTNSKDSITSDGDVVQGDLRAPLLYEYNRDADTDLDLSDLESSQDNDIESTQENREDTQPTNNDIESRITGTKRLIKLAGPHTFYLYAGCIVLLIRLPFSLSIPHFVSETLGNLARSDFEKAKLNIFYLIALGTVDAALDFWCVFLFGLTNLNITKGLRIDTFAAILKQEVAFFDMISSGDLASRLNSDCGEMSGDLTWFFRFSIESVVRIVSIVSYMLWRSPRLGACAISVVPVVAVINKKYGDFLNQNAIEVQNALAKANSVASEAFSCIRTVISFASEQHEYKSYKNLVDIHYDLNVKQLYAQGFYYMMISTFLINTIVQGLLLYVGLLMVRNGDLAVEVLLAFMLYQGGLQNEVMNLFNSYTSLIKSSGAGDKVFELLDRQTPEPGTGHYSRADIKSSVYQSQVEPNITNQPSLGIKIRQLRFHYPSRPDQEILKGLDLDIPAGKTVALVGKSGCGKSTLHGLLQRFYDPSSGSILINENNLKDINLMSHRSKIGVVTQDPVLFTGSIKDNIVYGLSENSTSQDDVVNAAKLANAHDFIVSFPDGYDTQVGERGLQLSGGQKQRIAIARAIISKPRLLLLDEATSALDSESEKIVQQALDQFILESNNNQMTTVVIAHRLQTVRNADIIVVLSDGVVMEQGNHIKLMENNGGIYRSMVMRAGIDGNLSDG